MTDTRMAVAIIPCSDLAADQSSYGLGLTVTADHPQHGDRIPHDPN